MASRSLHLMARFLKTSLEPWHKALANPAMEQERVLKCLLMFYGRTDYGKQRGAALVSCIDDYRRLFPVITYRDIKPLIQRVMAGETNLLLHETPAAWATTRNTTGGEPKFIPLTPTDLRMRVDAAPRADMNWVLSNNRYELLDGVYLNLHWPSLAGKVKVNDVELEYGYCSGIDARYVSSISPIRFLPSQEDIDALGGGKTDKDWETRFELAYQKCKDENVTQIGGVLPTVLLFGDYLMATRQIYPKDIWKVLLMTGGSVPGANTRHKRALTTRYGDLAIREIYGATEGMFGQQMDEYRGWVPNYDLFFFEVQIGSTIKMLHEMRTWETGSLIVSTPALPRYKVGDLIRAHRTPYFRCIGRDPG